jgi:tRNA G18 (ribose-2'-O)-methylase SpoU
MTEHVTSLSSLDDPLIKDFISLKSSTLFKEDLILIESHKVILKAISSQVKILKILTSISLYQENISLFSDVEHIYCLPDDVINKVVGQSFHGGIMAICQRPAINNFIKDEPILVLNGVTSPENVGAMIRSAVGFNVKNILIDHKSCHPHVKRAIRVSMGNVFFCCIEKTSDLKKRLVELRNDGYDILSFANLEGSESLNTFQFKKKSCLIIGSEGHGIEESIFKISDHIIKIDMNNEVQHFNAACATSIFLYAFNNHNS